jgi:hypothetical protein
MSEREMKLKEYYKKLVSKMILKVYNNQQKIIDKLNIEIIELKMMLSQKQSTIHVIKRQNLFTDKITKKTFRLYRSDYDDSE